MTLTFCGNYVSVFFVDLFFTIKGKSLTFFISNVCYQIIILPWNEI